MVRATDAVTWTLGGIDEHVTWIHFSSNGRYNTFLALDDVEFKDVKRMRKFVSSHSLAEKVGVS